MDEMLDVADQPHRTGGPLMTMRITNQMMSRTSLSRPQRRVSQRPATARSGKMSSGKQITKPSDDPFGTSRALSPCAATSRRPSSTSRTSTRRPSWQNVTDAALGAHHRRRSSAPASCSSRARNGLARPERRARRSPSRDRPARRVRQDRGQRASTAAATSSPAPRPTTRPYAVGGADAYAGDAGNVVARDRPGRLGPGQRARRRRLLGDGQSAEPDGKLLDDAARHRRPPARRHGGRRQLAAHHRPPGPRRATSTRSRQTRATVGATTNRLETAASACPSSRSRLDQAPLERRGRRHGQDPHRLLHSSNPSTSRPFRPGRTSFRQSLLDFLR